MNRYLKRITISILVLLLGILGILYVSSVMYFYDPWR